MARDILVLTEADLRGLVRLDMGVVDVVERAFAALATGGVVMPPIMSMEIPDAHGEVDVKTAYIPGFDGFAIKVSPGFFDVMSVQPALGRGFRPDEDVPGRDNRAVLGHDLWQRRFAGDASILGHTVQIDGSPYEVVGIAPPGFDFPVGTHLWAPLAFNAKSAADRRSGDDATHPAV